MMQKLIIEWLFRLRIKKNNIPVEGFKKIKNIVIIINLDENTTCDLEALIYSFQALGKKVQSIGVTLAEQTPEQNTMKMIIKKDDFTFRGKPKTTEIQQFFNMKFDYVLLIDQSNNYLVNHVAIHCKANCYIGYRSIPENKLLTLQIAPLQENEHEDFLRYIKLIEN
ncbi:MAG: hypothetical protein P8N26_04545 [Cyclobacteriaceae bacterium]|nr:hypothetical protein [Cyclobacteriaceae bacterium]